MIDRLYDLTNITMGCVDIHSAVLPLTRPTGSTAGERWWSSALGQL